MKDVKNIITIAPFLADGFVDFDDVEFDLDKYSRFISENSGRLGGLRKYLICRLHDSWVVDILNQNDILTIKLSDFSTHVFADALIDRFLLPLNSDMLTFPLNIEFKGDLKVAYYKVDKDGILHEIEPLSLDVYLYEQITGVDNERIEIVFNFWKNASEREDGENVILIITANEISVTEIQDQSWNELFKHKYIDYYKYFKTQFTNERYVSDYNECVKLIKEVDSHTIT